MTPLTPTLLSNAATRLRLPTEPVVRELCSPSEPTRAHDGLQSPLRFSDTRTERLPRRRRPRPTTFWDDWWRWKLADCPRKGIPRICWWKRFQSRTPARVWTLNSEKKNSIDIYLCFAYIIPHPSCLFSLLATLLLFVLFSLLISMVFGFLSPLFVFLALGGWVGWFWSPQVFL